MKNVQTTNLKRTTIQDGSNYEIIDSVISVTNETIKSNPIEPNKLIAGSGINVNYDNVTGNTTISNSISGVTDQFGLTNTPATATANNLRIFSQQNTPYFGNIDDAGNRRMIIPFYPSNTVLFSAIGNNSTSGTLIGQLGFTAVGTSIARSVDFTNAFTAAKRIGYQSATTAGALVSLRFPTTQFSIGTTLSGVKVGGFYAEYIFGISDAATVSGARMFVGMAKNTAAATNVEPSTLVNVLGVGHGAGDSNLKIYYGGITAQPPINLGVNFPNSIGQGYKVSFYNPIGTSIVHYRIKRLNTGQETSGTISSNLPTPASGTTGFLNAFWAYRTNNATALAVGLDLISINIQTEY